MSKYIPLTSELFEFPDNFFIPSETYAEVSFIIRHEGTKLAPFIKADAQFIDCTVRFDVSANKTSIGLSVYDLAEEPTIKNRVKHLNVEKILSEEEAGRLAAHAFKALWPKVSHLEHFKKTFSSIASPSEQETVSYPIWIRSFFVDREDYEMDEPTTEEFYVNVPKGTTIVQIEKAVLDAHNKIIPYFTTFEESESRLLSSPKTTVDEEIESILTTSINNYTELVLEYVCRLHHWSWRPLRYAIGIDLLPPQ